VSKPRVAHARHNRRAVRTENRRRKTLPLATLAEAVTDQNLEAVLRIVGREPDAASVEALCGEKHAHGNGDQRFQRAGTDTRTADEIDAQSKDDVTTAGEHEFQPLRRRYSRFPRRIQLFRPVEDVLHFDGQNRYQQDIAAKSVELATSLSYRDAANHGDSFLDAVADHHQPPKKKYGHVSSNSSFQTVSLAQTLTPSFLTGQSATAKTTTARPTPSKTLGEDTAEESRPLLDLSVNADWDETAAELDDIGAVTDDATVVSDADSGIVTAFTDENRDHQNDPSTSAERWVTPSGTMASSLGPSEGDRFEGDRRGVPSEELCGEASSSGGVRGDPLADRANERAIREDSVATGAVRGQSRLQGIFGGGCRRL